MSFELKKDKLGYAKKVCVVGMRNRRDCCWKRVQLS